MFYSMIRGGRRRRFTVVKWLLVVLALLGVFYWFTQTRHSLPSDADVFPHEPSKIEQNIVIPNSVLQNEDKKVILKLHPSAKDVQNSKTKLRQISRGGDELPDKRVKFYENVIMHPESENGEKVKLMFKNIIKNSDNGQIAAPFRNDDSGKRTTTSTTKLPSVDRNSLMRVTPGLGENGVAVVLSPEEQDKADAVFNEAAFNVYISDRISLNRTVPDTRHELCAMETYDSELPSTSVIIIFYNEVWSALLRTIQSVVNRTPPHLLKEIILVDDFSTREELKGRLVKYLNSRFPAGNVKVVRMPSRQGLIRSRLAGAKVATGDVLVFLDSHCEVNVQWLEPMLQRIKLDRKTFVCPIIDIIDDKSMEYQSRNGDYFQIGGFTWAGNFDWIDISDSADRKSAIEPAKYDTIIALKNELK